MRVGSRGRGPRIAEPRSVERPEEHPGDEKRHLVDRAWHGQNAERGESAKRLRDPAIDGEEPHGAYEPASPYLHGDHSRCRVCEVPLLVSGRRDEHHVDDDGDVQDHECRNRK